MTIQEFTEILDTGEEIGTDSEVRILMHQLSQEALRITSELNNQYHTPEEIRVLMTELTGQEIDETFGLFPPFYTDCGKNTHFGKHVFINAGCKFQDQGGIYIGDDAIVAAGAVVTKDVEAKMVVAGVPAKPVKTV